MIIPWGIFAVPLCLNQLCQRVAAADSALVVGELKPPGYLLGSQFETTWPDPSCPAHRNDMPGQTVDHGH